MQSFITILYDFEKQWLSSFACKAIVIIPVPQKFISLVKDRNQILQNEKKCKEKKLIWHMVDEMVKKYGRARLYISYNYSCIFIVHKGVPAPLFLRHPPLDPACPTFLKSLFPLPDMFINMRQPCGHWKIGKNTYTVTKWSFSMLQS